MRRRTTREDVNHVLRFRRERSGARLQRSGHFRFRIGDEVVGNHRAESQRAEAHASLTQELAARIRRGQTVRTILNFHGDGGFDIYSMSLVKVDKFIRTNHRLGQQLPGGDGLPADFFAQILDFRAYHLGLRGIGGIRGHGGTRG